MTDPLENLPLSPTEKARYTAEAAKGNLPHLSIVKRFILTIRKSFTASPEKTEKAKTSRNAKPQLSEDQMDFF